LRASWNLAEPVTEAGRPEARSYHSAGLPAPGSAWRETDFTVIDFETTGLDPTRDEIISFATVTVSAGRVRLDDARYELVRPKQMPGWDTIRIHGLREADLEDAPRLSEQIPKLLVALTGRVLVAHVAAIERSFLEAAFEPQGLELRNPIVDTAALFAELSRRRRKPPPKSEPVSLDDMSRSLGLPVHRRHTADGDALTTAQAFIALATHLDGFQSQTVETLLGASGRRPGMVERLRALLRL
jgi:DNA polymerase-3 subunit epsilon